MKFYLVILGWYLQYTVINSHLADVVQERADADAFDLRFRQAQPLRSRHRETRNSLGVAARIRIFAVNRCGERFDRAEKKFVVLVSRALQVSDELFDLIGHLIERLAQFPQLSSAWHLHPPRKISRRDSARACRQLAHRPGQLLSKIEADQQSQSCRQQAYEQGLIAHVAD